MPRYQLRGSKRRNAAILFVCVVLLTLFLVIGLCFVLFKFFVGHYLEVEGQEEAAVHAQ